MEFPFLGFSMIFCELVEKDKIIEGFGAFKRGEKVLFKALRRNRPPRIILAECDLARPRERTSTRH